MTTFIAAVKAGGVSGFVAACNVQTEVSIDLVASHWCDLACTGEGICENGAGVHYRLFLRGRGIGFIFGLRMVNMDGVWF